MTKETQYSNCDYQIGLSFTELTVHRQVYRYYVDDSEKHTGYFST